MKLGILSDTHNHLANLTTAMELFRAEQVTRLIHCGDFTSAETAGRLKGFVVHHAWGNGDFDFEGIQAALIELDPENTSALLFSAVLNGKKIAAVHGHERGRLDVLIQNGHYDYVFHGHSHRRRDVQIGATRVINPGALGGLAREERSICILDLETGDADFRSID